MTKEDRYIARVLFANRIYRTNGAAFQQLFTAVQQGIHGQGAAVYGRQGIVSAVPSELNARAMSVNAHPHLDCRTGRGYVHLHIRRVQPGRYPGRDCQSGRDGAGVERATNNAHLSALKGREQRIRDYQRLLTQYTEEAQKVKLEMAQRRSRPAAS